MYLCVVLLAATMLAGCATTGVGPTDSVTVTLVNNQEVRIRGKQVTVDALPQKLKSMGVKPENKIIVVIPSSAPLQLVANMTARLRSAGFGLVHFERPRSAGAYLKK